MSTSAPAPPPVKPTNLVKWHRTTLGLCLVVFAFELGLFLIVFPWLASWDTSYVPLHMPQYSDLWTSSYFRGAVSGLGLINIYVSVAEAARLVRFLFAR